MRSGRLSQASGQSSGQSVGMNLICADEMMNVNLIFIDIIKLYTISVAMVAIASNS